MKRSSFLIMTAVLLSYSLQGQPAKTGSRELNRFETREAKQAVAVDKDFFYVINSSTITKHDKKSGTEVKEWDGTEMGIRHLNSGVVIKGKLYCINTNYPDSPMASSVEIFDAATLKHTGNHSFGIFTGSATWIDRKDGCWYVGFAHYTDKGSSEGKDTRWTSVVKFDRKWHQIEAWIFPEDLVKLFSPMSNSGGVFGKDGFLYCTGHDNAEIYVLEIPESGYTLHHIKTINAPIRGQGIACDLSETGRKVFYGIQRDKNLVTAFEVE